MLHRYDPDALSLPTRTPEPAGWLWTLPPSETSPVKRAATITSPFESTVARVQTGPAVRGAPTRSEFGNVEGVPGFPRGYQVQVSMDGSNWGTPVAEGQGTGAQTVIAFAPTRARFVRITQTAAVDDAPPLSIRRLRVFGAGTLKGDSQH